MWPDCRLYKQLFRAFNFGVSPSSGKLDLHIAMFQPNHRHVFTNSPLRANDLPWPNADLHNRGLTIGERTDNPSAATNRQHNYLHRIMRSQLYR